MLTKIITVSDVCIHFQILISRHFAFPHLINHYKCVFHVNGHGLAVVPTPSIASLNEIHMDAIGIHMNNE